MTTAATIAARLILDKSNYDSGLKEADRSALSFAKKLQGIGGQMSKVGGLMTAGLTVPIIGAGVAMVNLASSYEESLNKVKVVFGDNAAAIEEWSKDSATAIGISQAAALEAAGTYGNLFTALGVLPDAAQKMSTNLVELSADLASFNDANPEDVLLALRSGLSGEIEPLKKYGVAMNEAIMKQKAMEMGLGDNIQALTEAQKLQVRYAIILEQTATAQGDFARTSEGLANQTRILKARVADAGIALGQLLLPYALKAVTIFQNLLTKFEALDPSVKKGILIFIALVAVLGPLLLIIGSVVTAIGAIGGAIAAISWPVVGVILLIIAAVYLLYQAWVNNWMGIQQIVKRVAAWLLDMFFRLRFHLVNALPKAIEILKQAWEKHFIPVLKKVVEWGNKHVMPFLKAAADLLKTLFAFGVQFAAQAIRVFLLPALERLGQFLVKYILPAVKTLALFMAISVVQGLINVGKVLDWLTKQFIKFNQYIQKMELPSWMTPGSPTPLETGLRGIGSAMDQLNRRSLPTFSAGLELSPVNTPNFIKDTPAVNRTVNLTIQAQDMTMQKVIELIDERQEQMVESLIKAIA